jgi:TrmH family RNA methyltransferase
MYKIERITSRNNQRLVNARRVRDGKIANRVFVEGRRLANEALRSGVIINEGFVAEGFRDVELFESIGKRDVEVAEIPYRIFRSIADTAQPQGIILIATRPETSSALIDIGLRTAKLPLVIFLKETNNPSNLGAIFRTAEAAGVVGVIVSKNSADVFSPKALRAAMGSSLRLPVWEYAEFDEVLEWAKAAKLTTTMAEALSGVPYIDINWKMPRLLIFGSEAHGFDASELAKIDELTCIPMDNGVESLNLAVSAGIILFEAKRQIS